MNGVAHVLGESAYGNSGRAIAPEILLRSFYSLVMTGFPVICRPEATTHA